MLLNIHFTRLTGNTDNITIYYYYCTFNYRQNCRKYIIKQGMIISIRSLVDKSKISNKQGWQYP